MTKLSTWLLNCSERIQRTVALSILLVLVVLIGAAAESAIVSLSKLQGEITAKREHLGHLEAFAKLLPRAQGVQPQPASTRGEDFLEGASEPIIRANFQARLANIAKGAGVDLQSIGALPDETVDKTRYVGMRLNLSGPNNKIHEMIFKVETSSPWLLIREARIWSAGNVQEVGDRPPTISAEIQVLGALPPDIAPRAREVSQN